MNKKSKVYASLALLMASCVVYNAFTVPESMLSGTALFVFGCFYVSGGLYYIWSNV